MTKEKTGADMPFQTYLACDFETSGQLISPSREYRTLAAEAVGRTAVKLSKENDCLSIKARGSFNALTVRYSIPDENHNAVISNVPAFSASLTLYAGADRYSLLLDTAHSHLYGNFPWSKDRALLGEHKFFDEVSILLPKAYEKGAEIRLVKEKSDCSPYYIVNLIETEAAPEPIEKPLGAVSLQDFLTDTGEDGGFDEALEKAYAACLKTGEKTLFIPAGSYAASKRFEIHDDGVTVCGAGMWRTEFKGGICFNVFAKGVTFRDFKMSGNVTVRRDTEDTAAIETGRGAERLTLRNLWICRHKVGAWINYASGTTMEGCRCRELYADGVNLHSGVQNSVIRNNHFRGTGDDSIAMWSEKEENAGNTVENNTVESPWLANCIAAYGGKDIKIANNLVSDTVYAGAGINISSNFKPTPFGGTVLVENNTVVRCGSKRNSSDIGAVWFNTLKDNDNAAKVVIKNNTVLDSSFQGIFFEGGGVLSGAAIEGNLFSGMSTHFADCVDDAKNTVRFSCNTVEGYKGKKYNNPLGMGLSLKDIEEV